MLAAAVDRARTGQRDVVEFFAANQWIWNAIFGVGLGLALEAGRMREAQFLEGLGRFDDRALFEMKIEIGADHKTAR